VDPNDVDILVGFLMPSNLVAHVCAASLKVKLLRLC
jgi:hypothetical protein